MPLISPDQTLVLSAIFMVVVAFCMWAERRPWGQKIGGPLLLIGIGMALANTGFIPYSAPVYGTIASFLVPAAIPLLLLRADLRTIFSESGPMLTAFLVAAAATVVGAFAGAWAIDMGPFEAQIAGTVTSSYIGGSLNFVATAEATGISDSAIYAAGLSADAVGAVFFLLMLMLMPTLRLVRNAMPSRFDFGAGSTTETAATPNALQGTHPFSIERAACALAISLVICALSDWIASVTGSQSWYILIVTTLSLVVANLGKPLVRYVSADFELGTLFMYLFFVAIGAGANLADVVGAAMPILLFIVVMVSVHLVLIVIAGKFLKLDLAEVMIASNACILGPAPAAALAASRGWQALVAPGILVGMFGYAIATFIGVAIAAALS